MSKDVKKEIQLNESVVVVLAKTKDEVEKLQAQILEKNQMISNILTGICLNEGVDPAKEGINISEDLKSLLVYNLPEKNDESTDPEKDKPTKIKKMK